MKGLAYSGWKMRLFGWTRPVVVDMAGMNIPESVPLLTNHVNDTLCRVGGDKAVCKGESPEIEAKAISEGWRKDQLNEAVLAAFRAKQPTTDVNITIKKENAMTAKRLEAALSLRAGIGVKQTHTYARSLIFVFHISTFAVCDGLSKTSA